MTALPETHPLQPIYDIAILGGGPAGLYGCFYAGLRQLKVLLVESAPCLGGQLATLYPEKWIYDVAGFPKVLADDLACRLIEQAMSANPAIHLNCTVNKSEMATDTFLIHHSKGIFSAKTLLIAGGIGAFTPKPLVLDGLPPSLNELAYTLPSAESLKGRSVVIVGGGSLALEWAIQASTSASSVTLIHHRPTLRATEINLNALQESTVRLRLGYHIESIQTSGRLKSIIIANDKSGKRETLPVDHLLVNLGFESSLSPLMSFRFDWQGGQVKVDSTMQTHHPRIYAAGDIATYPGKLKLIANAFAEAAIAVNHIAHVLDPKKSIFPGHSTNLKRLR